MPPYCCLRLAVLLATVCCVVEVLGPGDSRVTDAGDVVAAVDVLSASAGSLTVSANKATCGEVEFRAAPDVSQTELVVVIEDVLLLLAVLVLSLRLLLLPLLLPSSPRRLVVVADGGGVVVVVSGNAALVPNACKLDVLATVPGATLAADFGATPGHMETKSSQQFPYCRHSAVHWQEAPFLKEPQPYALQVTGFR